MKQQIKNPLIVLLMFLGFQSNLLGATTSAPANAPEAAKKKAGIGTSHNFEDLLVQGKYHFSDESVTTVEEDKVLDALIGVRSDFKDRLKKSTARK